MLTGSKIIKGPQGAANHARLPQVQHRRLAAKAQLGRIRPKEVRKPAATRTSVASSRSRIGMPARRLRASNRACQTLKPRCIPNGQNGPDVERAWGNVAQKAVVVEGQVVLLQWLAHTWSRVACRYPPPPPHGTPPRPPDGENPKSS